MRAVPNGLMHGLYMHQFVSLVMLTLPHMSTDPIEALATALLPVHDRWTRPEVANRDAHLFAGVFSKWVHLWTTRHRTPCTLP